MKAERLTCVLPASGLKWLIELLSPASAFVLADSEVARKPARKQPQERWWQAADSAE